MPRTPPIEISFAAAMVAVMIGFSLRFELPIRFPAAGGAEFIGIHYLMPLLGVVLWGGWALLGGDGSRIKPLMTALICYAVVLLVHFHIKLWAPIINPASYDQAFWWTDQQVRPLIDASFAIRRSLAPIVPYHANFYMIGFVLLFYGSFSYHALRTPEVFRTLFLAALFMQGLGALAYLVTPAIGPFVFEHGANPTITAAQQYMMSVRQQMIVGGPDWLSANEAHILLTGLGAMPSLHAGCSAIFLWFAFRHGRVLLPIYVPIFGYIIMNSVASRWHYLIDLPVGFALAALCIWLAHRCTRERAPLPRPFAEPPGLEGPALAS